MLYEVLYEDDSMEIIHADDDKEALEKAETYVKEYGIIFNVFELDKKLNEIRTVF